MQKIVFPVNDEFHLWDVRSNIESAGILEFFVWGKKHVVPSVIYNSNIKSYVKAGTTANGRGHREIYKSKTLQLMSRVCSCYKSKIIEPLYYGFSTFPVWDDGKC